MLALNENYQCWGWDGGLARIGPKGILPRIGCRSRFGVVLARWHRSCGLLRRPERHRHRRVSYRERTACGPPCSQVYAEGTERLDDHADGYRCQRQCYWPEALRIGGPTTGSFSIGAMTTTGIERFDLMAP